MSADNALRTALHDLAPEPPDDLGLPQAARNRARVVQRRRRSAAASATVLSVVAVLGVTFLGGASRPDLPPAAGEVTGTFPEWEARGDLINDDTVVDAAMSAWVTAVARQGIDRTASRALYAGGGDEPVVVLHGTVERGGERLVVVTREKGKYEVYADIPAPMPGVQQISVLFGAPAERPVMEGPCVPTPDYVAGTRQRLLVLGPPDRLASVDWQLVRALPAACSTIGAATDPQAIALTDGAALADVRVGRHGDLEMYGVNRDGSAFTDGPTIVGRTGPARYPAFEVVDFVPPTGLDWPLRTDESRADDFAESVRMRNSIQEEYGECRAHVALSLPDATPVVLCVTTSDHPDPQVVIWAENGDRKARSYAQIELYKPGSPYSAIVEGHRNRWLVVIGPPDQNQVTLVDGSRRTDLPMTRGVGYLELTSELSANARLTSSDFAPGGGFAIADRTGKDRVPRP